ncbi:unnamed protein product [Hermetia illucens]|uniref:Sodium/calcium exchanger membrane region domain-containing protein n=1 Tax=Hermetia illucens TaxID=343691 RepID=A0A7R8UWL1_HERIL|nr:sodium/potassium/calcium exchanger 3-like [Hermetia illucens]CAD7087881.1 unnamed protein product [Hermetia illucens]
MNEVSIESKRFLQKRKSRLALGIRLTVFLSVVSFFLIFSAPQQDEFEVNAARSHARKLLSINETFSVTELGISIAEFNATTPNPENITNISSSNITANANVEIEANCTRPAIHEFPQDGFTRSQRKHGAVAIHIFLACYCFWLLAVICDDYFVPSIEVMCFTLQMKEDVVGATFMAAATSSPELFINCIGTFITKGDIGVGTIVGSAVFNILAVPACCGLFAGHIVYLDWWPVSRDCLMYCIAVFGLIGTLYDGVIMWYEGLLLTIAYFFYMFAMYCNDAMARKARRLVAKCRHRTKIHPYKEVTEISPLLECNGNGIKISNGNGFTMNGLYHGDKSIISDDSISSDSDRSELADDPWSRRDSNLCTFLLRWPITLVLWATIPDCRKRPQLKAVTFLLSIVWIGITSYLVAFFITIIGDTLNIPDSVMGLTILAAGMSVPEAVSSVIVTNQGHGAMGISNSIGSNTFDILLCLGLPWFIKAYFAPAVPGEHWIILNSSGLTYSAISLLTTLFGLYIAFAANKFKLDWRIGVACTVMYVGFLILATMIELNLFFAVNLPVCDH